MFEAHGWGALTDELHALIVAGRLEDAIGLITPDILDTYCVTARWDGLADALTARYDGLADRVALYSFVWMSREQRERWRDVVNALQRTGTRA
ncbi:hypothetical protein GCM10012275_26520 [Longimycelium tulufanense]|uniref:Uncharacterized protein n=1 Tax=Longimycelium tulufanense TaxID=907463 RepID=A0A8J3FUD4_9PSEU|nr:hypothetical protein [Longimycelium tulufanense]GGM54095.1 hypothetical protein GCM10012275_26520 [Longimycelium tulufanense]